MANTPFYIKRTTVSGRTPNTTASYTTNTQYISTGEPALNLTDRKMFVSDGTIPFEVGANVVNQNVSNTLTVAGSITAPAIAASSGTLQIGSNNVNISTANGVTQVLGPLNAISSLSVVGTGTFSNTLTVSGATTCNGTITTGVYTVANLPAGSITMRAFVSDATSTTFASVVAGGGTNKVPVYHNGTNWMIG